MQFDLSDIVFIVVVLSIAVLLVGVYDLLPSYHRRFALRAVRNAPLLPCKRTRVSAPERSEVGSRSGGGWVGVIPRRCSLFLKTASCGRWRRGIACAPAKSWPISRRRISINRYPRRRLRWRSRTSSPAESPAAGSGERRAVLAAHPVERPMRSNESAPRHAAIGPRSGERRCHCRCTPGRFLRTLRRTRRKRSRALRTTR